MLDLGCGGGHVSYRAALHVGEVVACDVTQGMLDVVARTAVERGFDNITIQTGSGRAAALRRREFRRRPVPFHHASLAGHGIGVAGGAPGGEDEWSRLSFMDCRGAAERVFDTQAVEVLRDASHVRNYSVAEWLSALARAGFAIESVTTRKLRMIFPTWIARTRTTPEMALAIRQFQGRRIGRRAAPFRYRRGRKLRSGHRHDGASRRVAMWRTRVRPEREEARRGGPEPVRRRHMSLQPPGNQYPVFEMRRPVAAVRAGTEKAGEEQRPGTASAKPLTTRTATGPRVHAAATKG